MTTELAAKAVRRRMDRLRSYAQDAVGAARRAEVENLAAALANEFAAVYEDFNRAEFLRDCGI